MPKTHTRGLSKAVRSLARRGNTSLFDIGVRANREDIWDYVCQKRALSDAASCLTQLLPPDVQVTQDLVKEHLDELIRYEPLRELLDTHRKVIDHRVVLPTLEQFTARSLFCYVATRLLKPTTVVETGCATGWMSALFLLALSHNQQGQLFSIDLPPVVGQHSMNWTLPEHVPIGFLVPQALRSRWTLTTGNARTELMPLLDRIGSVDIFCHDSDHSYVHMMWEYTAVWPYLASRGVLISDDIGWNTAFWDFATAVERPTVVHSSNTNFGALSKS